MKFTEYKIHGIMEFMGKNNLERDDLDDLQFLFRGFHPRLPIIESHSGFEDETPKGGKVPADI